MIYFCVTSTFAVLPKYSRYFSNITSQFFSRRFRVMKSKNNKTNEEKSLEKKIDSSGMLYFNLI